MWNDDDIMIAEQDYEKAIETIKKYYLVIIKQLRNNKRYFLCNEMLDAMASIGMNQQDFEKKIRLFVKTNRDDFEEFMRYYFNY